MSEPEDRRPRVAATAPARVELQPGKQAWCACGMSATQPLCDGTHRGTEFRPVKWIVEEPTTATLCMCKRTGNPPYCDGTHATLRAAEGRDGAAS